MSLTIVVILAVLILWVLNNSKKVVPLNEVFVVERLGEFKVILGPGTHFLIPFIEKVAYKHTLKEQVINVPPKLCITKDKISVEVDGVLYLKVINPKDASYGVTNYRFATMQIAQTTMRDVISKLAMDRIFEEREAINYEITSEVAKVSVFWGVKVQKYEVENIIPKK